MRAKRAAEQKSEIGNLKFDGEAAARGL